MSYANVFVGSPTHPSDVGFVALAPTAGSTTQLTWPELGGTTPIARIVKLTPAGAATVKLPQADLRSPGEDVLLQNVSAFDVTVQNYTGSEITIVSAGEAKYIYLSDNSTAAGAWAAVAFGAGASAADAAQLAGPGMDAAMAKLVVDFPVSSNTSGVTVTTADRGKAYVFTASSATVALPAVATATDGFYFAVRNSGTGTVTVDPDGAETVDGASSLALAPGESAFVVCSGGTWYSYGYGRSVAFAITQFTKDLTGLTSYTITTAEAANKLVKFVGTLAANCTVTIPTVASVYFLQNATSVAVAETVTVKTAAGSGVTLNTNDRQVVYCDGVNVVSATTTTISAPAAIPAGSAGGPSVYFSTDTDTGIYLVGTNSFGISTGGTKRLEVSSTAVTATVPISGTDVTTSGAITANGTLVLPVSTTPAQTAEGSVVWDSDDNLLTVGDGAARKTMIDDVVFPGLSKTRAWRVQTKSGSYALAVTDNMTQINVTAAATISGVAATLGNGFVVLVYNTHTAAITGPDGVALPAGQAKFYTSSGSTIYGFRLNQNGAERIDVTSFTGVSSILFTGLDALNRWQIQLNFFTSTDASIWWQSGSGSIDGGTNYYTISQYQSTSMSSPSSLRGAAAVAGYISAVGVNATTTNRLLFNVIPNGNQMLVTGQNILLDGSTLVNAESVFGMHIGSGTDDRIQIYPGAGTFTGIATLYGFR